MLLNWCSVRSSCGSNVERVAIWHRHELATISGLARATVPDDVNPHRRGAPRASFDTSFGRGLDTYEFQVP